MPENPAAQSGPPTPAADGRIGVAKVMPSAPVPQNGSPTPAADGGTGVAKVMPSAPAIQSGSPTPPPDSKALNFIVVGGTILLVASKVGMEIFHSLHGATSTEKGILLDLPTFVFIILLAIGWWHKLKRKWQNDYAGVNRRFEKFDNDFQAVSREITEVKSTMQVLNGNVEREVLPQIQVLQGRIEGKSRGQEGLLHDIFNVLSEHSGDCKSLENSFRKVTTGLLALLAKRTSKNDRYDRSRSSIECRVKNLIQSAEEAVKTGKYELIPWTSAQFENDYPFPQYRRVDVSVKATNVGAIKGDLFFGEDGHYRELFVEINRARKHQISGLIINRIFIYHTEDFQPKPEDTGTRSERDLLFQTMHLMSEAGVNVKFTSYKDALVILKRVGDGKVRDFTIFETNDNSHTVKEVGEFDSRKIDVDGTPDTLPVMTIFEGQEDSDNENIRANWKLIGSYESQFDELWKRSRPFNPLTTRIEELN